MYFSNIHNLEKAYTIIMSLISMVCGD